jgi:diguanylate cyclase (GGDEF)-like protein
VGWAEALPRLVVAGKFDVIGAGLLIQILICLVTMAALASVVRLRTTVPENLWLAVGLLASCAEIWLTLHGSARFAVGWYLAKVGSLLTSLVVLVSMMHEITRLYSEAAVSNRTLATLAQRDGLTGLSNRRHFDELFVQEFQRACRQELPLALVMIDVDNFKAYNDRYGHPAGDECLRSVCATVAAALRRPGDHVARYGGEEIVVLLPATDVRGAMLVAEKVRSAVATLAIEHLGSDKRVVTISSGVSGKIPFEGDTPAHLLSTADRALYRAKRAGRNCVACATEDDLQLATQVEHGMAPAS